jgi:hypothetical protein
MLRRLTSTYHSGYAFSQPWSQASQPQQPLPLRDESGEDRGLSPRDLAASYYNAAALLIVDFRPQIGRSIPHAQALGEKKKAWPSEVFTDTQPGVFRAEGSSIGET